MRLSHSVPHVSDTLVAAVNVETCICVHKSSEWKYRAQPWFDLQFFFFFQAEDGIRDLTVTGVQTCALPILLADLGVVAARKRADEIVRLRGGRGGDDFGLARVRLADRDVVAHRAREQKHRSEERRVGEEGRSRWAPDYLKKKKKKKYRESRD